MEETVNYFSGLQLQKVRTRNFTDTKPDKTIKMLVLTDQIKQGSFLY